MQKADVLYLGKRQSIQLHRVNRLVKRFPVWWDFECMQAHFWWATQAYGGLWLVLCICVLGLACSSDERRCTTGVTLVDKQREKRPNTTINLKMLSC